MKKILFLFISSLTVLLFSCQNNTISGEIKGLKNAELSLVALQGGDNITLETITSKQGDFSFKNDYDSIFYAAITFEDKPLYAFFVEKGKIVINGDLNNNNDFVVKGGPITNTYNNFNEEYYKKQIAQNNLYSQIKELISDPENIDQDKADSLVAEFDSLDEQMYDLIKQYIDNNKDNVSGPLVTYQFNYLLTEDLFDINDSFTDNAKKGYYYSQLKSLLNRLEKVQVGKTYLDFEMPTPYGESKKLSDFVGNGYLLVDFWASWCSPCRHENPYVVEAYQRYNNKGFDVLGVSFDSNKESWIKAIKDDNLTWNHISELNKWQNVATDLYVISSIPSNVLLDENGVIVARNLRGEDLLEFLDSIYNK